MIRLILVLLVFTFSQNLYAYTEEQMEVIEQSWERARDFEVRNADWLEEQTKKYLAKYKKNQLLKYSDLTLVCKKILGLEYSEDSCMDLRFKHLEKVKSLSPTEKLIHKIKFLLVQASKAGDVRDYAKLEPYLEYPFKFCLRFHQSSQDRSSINLEETCPWMARDLEDFRKYANLLFFKSQVVPYLEIKDYSIVYSDNNFVRFQGDYEDYWWVYGDENISTVTPPLYRLTVECEDDDLQRYFKINYSERLDRNIRDQKGPGYDAFGNLRNELPQKQKACLNPVVKIRRATVFLIELVTESKTVEYYLGKDKSLPRRLVSETDN